MGYERFEQIIKERGIKVSEISRATGIRQSTFSDWKAGRYLPKADKIEAIADYLGVPVSEINGLPPKKNIIRVYHAQSASDGGKSKRPTMKILASEEYMKSHPPNTNAQSDVKSSVEVIAPEATIHKTKSYIDEQLTRIIKNSLFQSPNVKVTKQIPVLGRVAAGIPIEASEEILDWEEVTGDMAVHGDYFGLRINGDSMEPKFSDGDVVIVRQQEDADDGDIVIALVNGNDGVCKKLRKYNDGIALVSTNPAYEPMYFSKSDIDEKPVKIIGKVKELRAKF